MSVALHLQRAFAAREVTIASPFRPPQAAIVSNPYGVVPPKQLVDHHHHQGQPQGRGLAPAGHPLLATATPFTPAALRNRPPPIVVDATAPTAPAAPAAPEVPAPVVVEPVPLKIPYTVTDKGVKVFAVDAMKELSETAHAVTATAAVMELVRKMAPRCDPSWVAPSFTKAGRIVAGDDSRGGLFAGKSGKVRPERQLHHKVMSVLSRVTPTRYDELRTELLELPIRQADQEQLANIVDVFFNKAVHEDKFCPLYAGLVHSLFVAATEEANAAAATTPGTPNFAEKTSALAKNLRAALLHRCQQEFEKPFQLTHADLSHDGVPLSPDEVQEKQFALKKRLCGNVRFVGELYLKSMVTERVVISIVTRILSTVASHCNSGSCPPSASNSGQQAVTACDDLMEAFVTLLTHVGSRAQEKIPAEVKAWIQVAAEQSKSSNNRLSQRVKFLLMNIVDLAHRGWVDAPNTPAYSVSSSSKSSPTTPHHSKAAAGGKANTTTSTGFKQPASPAALPPKSASSSRGYLTDSLSSPATHTPCDSPQRPTSKKTTGASKSNAKATRETLSQLCETYPEVDMLVKQLRDHEVDSPSTVASTAETALSRFILNLSKTRKLSGARSSMAAIVRALTTANGTTDASFFSEKNFTDVIHSAIHSSIVDGVLEDCPHFFDNWCEIAKSSAADVVASRCCGPQVVLAALVEALAAAAVEGIIEDEEQELTRLGNATKPHGELHPAAPAALARVLAVA